MVSKPGRIGAADQLFQAAEVLAIQRLSRSKIHGDAVLYYAIALQNLVQYLEWAAAFHHEIFRDDFKPVNNWLLFKDVMVMRDAQANTDAVILESIETICGHNLCDIESGR